MPPEPNQDPTRGPQVTSLSIGDSADSWVAAGFNVDQRGYCQIGSVTIRLDPTRRSIPEPNANTGGEPTGEFHSWSFSGVAASARGIDGLAIDCFEDAGGAGFVHPNGVTDVDHIVISSVHPSRTVTELEQAGFPRRGERKARNSNGEIVQSFFWAGDVILELIGPGGGEVQGDSPSSVFGLALVSPDLAATTDFLGEFSSTPRTAVQKGRMIATVRTRRLGIGLPIAIMSPHPS